MKKIVVLLTCVLFYASVVPIVAETPEITEARLAGRNDAAVFKWKWFAAGYITANATPIVVALASWAHDELLVNPADAVDPVCLLAICGAYTLIPTAVAMINSPTPPADRLLGKSPEWVNAYTKAYKNVTRRHRTGATLIGCMAGGAVLAATIHAIDPVIFYYTGVAPASALSD